MEKEKIECTIDRNSLVNVFTPQVFDYSLIYNYIQKALQLNVEFTDDATILEYFNKEVYYELSSDDNIKNHY